jgi:hypothetical protein
MIAGPQLVTRLDSQIVSGFHKRLHALTNRRSPSRRGLTATASSAYSAQSCSAFFALNASVNNVCAILGVIAFCTVALTCGDVYLGNKNQE